jgi:hypothetical protein
VCLLLGKAFIFGSYWCGAAKQLLREAAGIKADDKNLVAVIRLDVRHGLVCVYFQYMNVVAVARMYVDRRVQGVGHLHSSIASDGAFLVLFRDMLGTQDAVQVHKF